MQVFVGPDPVRVGCHGGQQAVFVQGQRQLCTYQLDPVNVKMIVNPPRSWGKLLGTVKGRRCSNVVVPLPGAMVQVNGHHYAQTLKTDAHGKYAIWINSKSRPVADDRCQGRLVPQTRTTRVLAGRRTIVNYTLRHTC
jgi:hypothetical protein